MRAVDWSLALIPASCLVLVAVVCRLRQRSWLAPGAFYTLTWVGFGTLPVLVAPGYEVSPTAVWWLVAFSLTVFVGTEVGRSRVGDPSVPHPLPRSPDRLVSRRTLGGLLVVYALLGLLSTVLFLRSLGYGLSGILYLGIVTEIGREVSVARYTEGLAPSGISLFLVSAIYAGGALGGAYTAFFTHSQKRDGFWLGLLPGLPALFAGLVTTAKLGMIFTVILWLAGFLSVQVWVQGSRTRLFTKRRVLVGSIFAGVAAALFTSLNLIRYGWVGEGRGLDAFLRMRVYAFGHLSAFSQWFLEDGEKLLSLGPGVFTFAGPIDALGLGQRAQGVYGEPVSVARDGFTNVFSLYRGLIEDFGVLGTVVFLFAMGVVGGAAYKCTLSGSAGIRGRLGIAVLLLFYANTLSGSLVSIFTFNTLLIGIGIFGLHFVVRVPRFVLTPNGSPQLPSSGAGVSR